MRDWDSQVADLGSAYKLAPQSPGLPQTVNFSARVSLLILRLREVSSLSVGNYIQFGRSHESDFHGITRFGSKICHRSVTCDTRVTVCDSMQACCRAYRNEKECCFGNGDPARQGPTKKSQYM